MCLAAAIASSALVVAAGPAAAANCFAQAKPIVCGQTIHDSISDSDCDPSSSGSASRDDWYWFDVADGPLIDASLVATHDRVFSNLYELDPWGFTYWVSQEWPGHSEFEDWWFDDSPFLFPGRKYFYVSDTSSGDRGEYTLTLDCVNPATPTGVTPASVTFPVGGGTFRIWVLINGVPAHRETTCVPETICYSGALPGRSEVFVRMTGPRQGHFVPSLVKFNTTKVQIWIQQESTGKVNYYELAEASNDVWQNAGQHHKGSGFTP
jgi:hypothetical protein